MSLEPNNDVLKLDEIYDTASVQRHWSKERPYTFVFTANDSKQYYFNLPISPSNLNITTHFATNIIPTMYGTVEEHSEQRYFDITISGTTGMTPKYHNYSENSAILTKQNTGRYSYRIKDAFRAAGFAQRSLDLLKQTADRASELISKDQDKIKTGVALDQTGYVAFHNFYKFLLKYKKDVSNGTTSSRSAETHPLEFRNYKDNTSYYVAISNFQLTRDASNPMLYNYNIMMRGYNLQSAIRVPQEFDDSQEQLLKKLGLDGVNSSSLFSQIANKARQAKAAAYAAIASVKNAGR